MAVNINVLTSLMNGTFGRRVPTVVVFVLKMSIFLSVLAGTTGPTFVLSGGFLGKLFSANGFKLAVEVLKFTTKVVALFRVKPRFV